MGREANTAECKMDNKLSKVKTARTNNFAGCV